MLAEVFDMFIGLSLVRRLTELPGGGGGATSEGLGCGSTFTVRLPVVVTQETSPTPGVPSSETPKNPRLRILAIDDIADVADVLKMLADLGGVEARVVY